MLGQQLLRELRMRGHLVDGVSRQGPDYEVDFSKPGLAAALVRQLAPDTVWNAAAIVNLSACERDPGIAYAVNARAVAEMMQECRATGARLVQVSTDHYFCGDGKSLHDEAAPVQLVNEYARTKFAGEAFAITYSESLVLRTNITGFRGRSDEPTFAEWVFDVVTRDLPVTLFDDMYTSTLDTRSFCKVACDLLDKGARGIINLASSEVSTKKVFIEAVAASLGCSLSRASVGSVHTLTPPRANSLGLDVSRAEALLGYCLPDLATVIENLVLEYKGSK